MLIGGDLLIKIVACVGCKCGLLGCVMRSYVFPCGLGTLILKQSNTNQCLTDTLN